MSQRFDGTLDTNILLRYLLEDHSTQTQTAARLIEGSKVWRISVLAIAEIVFILQRKGLTRKEIKNNIDSLADYNNLLFDKQTAMAAAELYVKYPAISFVDAYLSYEADARAAKPLWTFDKKLARQAPHTKLVGQV